MNLTILRVLQFTMKTSRSEKVRKSLEVAATICTGVETTLSPSHRRGSNFKLLWRKVRVEMKTIRNQHFFIL